MRVFREWLLRCGISGWILLGAASGSGLTSAVWAQTVPDAPTIGTATPGNASADVAFTANGDGGAAIDQFRVTCNPGTITATGAASPINVTGLTNGTSYACTAAAHNSLGWSAESGSVAVTPRTVPDAPTIGTATPGDASVSVSFTAPAFNGGAAIDNYRAECNPGGATISGGTSPINVTGLSNGTSYTCTVAAHNVAGWGAPSAASNPATPLAPTAPSAPTIGTATAGDGQISVTFTGSGSPGTLAGGAAATITGYTATCGAQSNTGASSPIVVGGLTNGTSYTCTVTATNDVPLTSSSSAASNSVTPQAGTAPAIPTSVVGTRGNGQISVAFAASASPGTFPGGAPASITGYTATCGSQSNSGASSPIIVSGLTNGTSYTCTVTATNDVPLTSAASTASSPVTPATTPGTPTGVTASAGDASISVSFTPPLDDGGEPILNYRAECVPGGWTISNPGSPIVVTGLTNGTTYTCMVQAYNILGWSAWSTSSNSATPAAPTAPDAPTSVVGTPGNGTISVAFATSASPGTLPGGATATITTYTATCGAQSNSGSTSPILVSGLTNGTSYTCVVKATNNVPLDSANSSPSSPVTPRTVPVAPTIGAATPGNASATVAFTANGNGGAVIDDFRVTCNPGGISGTGASSPVTITGLTNGNTYTCTAAAHNEAGWSAESAASNSVTPRLEVQRAFVSASSGDDYNVSTSCSAAAPCRTFAAALPVTLAGGEVLALSSGDYGTIAPTKSVVLTAAPGQAASLTATSGSAVSVATSGVKVVLRNLQLVGAGAANGVLMTNGAELALDKCLVSGFSSNGISISTPAVVRIFDSLIRDNGGIGVRLANGARADIVGSKLYGNGYSGVVVDGSSPGTTTRATVTKSVVVGVKDGADWGVSAESYSATGVAQLEVVRSAVTHSTKGVVAYSTSGGSAVVTLARTRVNGNTTGLEQLGSGAVLRSRGNSSVNNNNADTSGTITPLAGM